MEKTTAEKIQPLLINRISIKQQLVDDAIKFN